MDKTQSLLNDKQGKVQVKQPKTYKEQLDKIKEKDF